VKLTPMEAPCEHFQIRVGSIDPPPDPCSCAYSLRGGARRPYFGINAVTHIDEDRCNKLETCPATNLLAFPHWAPVIRRVGVIDDGRAYLDTGWENFGALKPQHRFKDPFSSASSRGRVTRRRVAAVWTSPESSRPRYLQVEFVFAHVGRSC